jgi:glycosyltransferase involved in cell wall biosynthesis
MMTNRKTLVILSPGFPASEEDSTCLPAQQLFVRSVNRLFPDLRIVIFSFEYPFLRSTYLWHNNYIMAFGGRNRKKLLRLQVWLKVWHQLKLLNRRENIIGLLSFWCTETAFIGRSFARKNKLKHFCWILGQDARKGNRLIKFINPQPEELIAMSDAIATEFFSNYRIYPLHMIPNGIDPGIFPEACEKHIDISGAGSLIPLKRYDLFVKVFNKINKAMPFTKAILCGKGGEESTLKSLIEDLNLQNNIKMTGEVPHAEVLKIMQESKIFLHTSSYEGFSSACLEALCAGAHVISFSYPLKEKIDHWHIVHSENEMVLKATELLSNPSTPYTPVFPLTMVNSAAQMMNLFSPNPKAGPGPTP